MTTCRRLNFWLVALVTLASWGALFPLAAEEPRTWKDATGAFQIRATLVKAEEGKVHLLKSDGKTIVVPLDKLSAADREFVSSRAPQPARPEPAPAAPATAASGRASSLVMLKFDTSPFVGLVYAVQGEHAYIAVPYFFMERENYDTSEARPYQEFKAVMDSNGKALDVPLEKVAVAAMAGKWYFRGPAKDLPPPMPIGPPLQKGQAVTLIGYKQIGRQIDRKLEAYQLNDTLGVPFEHNKFERFPPGAKDSPGHAIAVDANGKLVGTRGFSASLYDGKASEGFASAAGGFPWAKPELGIAFAYPIAGDKDRVTWQFVVYVADPLGQIKSPKLGFHWRASTSMKSDPNATLVEVALTPGKPAEESVWHLYLNGWTPDRTVMIGTVETPNPGPEFRDGSFDYSVGAEDPTTGKMVWERRGGVQFRPQTKGNPPPASYLKIPHIGFRLE